MHEEDIKQGETLTFLIRFDFFTSNNTYEKFIKR